MMVIKIATSVDYFEDRWEIHIRCLAQYQGHGKRSGHIIYVGSFKEAGAKKE